MNDTVPRCLKIVQKGRQHGRALPLGVMKKHDSAMIGLQALHHQTEFVLGRHGIPVARPEVGAEHRDPSFGQYRVMYSFIAALLIWMLVHVVVHGLIRVLGPRRAE